MTIRKTSPNPVIRFPVTEGQKRAMWKAVELDLYERNQSEILREFCAWFCSNRGVEFPDDMTLHGHRRKPKK